jgi:hypothetical protein
LFLWVRRKNLHAKQLEPRHPCKAQVVSISYKPTKHSLTKYF